MKEWEVTLNLNSAEQTAEEAGGYLAAVLYQARVNFELISVEPSEDLSEDSRSSESLTQDSQSSEVSIVVIGNPIDGFRFVGLFANSEDAILYGDDELSGLDWCITKLDAPVGDRGWSPDPRDWIKS